MTQGLTLGSSYLECRETKRPLVPGASVTRRKQLPALFSRSCRLDEMSPRESWIEMALNEGSVLVDVRSAPEWSISGRPNLEGIGVRSVFVEWEIWPRNRQNLNFFSDLTDALADQEPSRMFFLCRSGPRAMSAAMEFSIQMSERGADIHCTNIANGFDGDLDANGQRATSNGWKHAGLPWLQD